MMLKVYYTEDSMENHQSSKTLRQEKKYIFSLKDINKFEKNINKLGFKINHLPNIVNNIYFDRIGTIIKKMPLKFTEIDYEKVKTEVEQEIVKKHLGCEY